MKQNRLGKSNIFVSDICMGTMTFGAQADEKTSIEILDKAYDAGIDFFDTAEIYPVPPDLKYVHQTEKILGRWIQSKDRDSLIVASKVTGPTHAWFETPVRAGKTALDRHNIVRAVEGSLQRLQTDYIDLYQTHWPDHDGDYEQTLLALDDLIQSGKVRIIGCSNETCWGLTKSLGVSEMHGLVRYQTIQNNFSLNNRRFEDELAQACRQEHVSLIPYSPLAGGVLSGKYNKPPYLEKSRFTKYLNSESRQKTMADRFVSKKAIESTKRFQAIAAECAMSVITLAIAWSKQHDFVASTIIGATSAEQLDDSLAAADVVLDKETLEKIDDVSRQIMYPMG